MQPYLSMLSECRLCPRRCGADRTCGEKGFCGAGGGLRIAHFGPHFGEEPPITGTKGSGNIFFSFCNLRCIFCQNHQISHEGIGGPASVDDLVSIFFSLRSIGCHNINLVSPTSHVPFIAPAIAEAKRRGLGLPFVYNTNAYDDVETLKSLEGLIDIYLPDFKYGNKLIAARLSHVPDSAPYPDAARAAILEMKRQVGDLSVKDNIAQSGIIVRHLVLPGGLAGSRRVFEWIGENLGRSTWIGLMSQYLPLHRSGDYPILARRIRQDEYESVISYLVDNGFDNVFIQELESAPLFVPDFRKERPFEENTG
jgi:putative pyruvate formate lyase activating enzyme